MTQSTRPAGERCHLPVVSLDNVSFHYEQRLVIEQLNFHILQRDFVGLIGSNGAGKTTLLRMIVGLLKPDEGEVRLFGTPLSKFRDWERIGYVPQKNAFNPLFPATVREVVTSGLYGRKKLFRPIGRDDKKKVDDALHALSIEELADRRIGRLSGGQQQRVFLARALVNGPELLILDEPTVGIDSETQEHFFHMIRHMHQRHNITFLMVSHDLDMMHAYLGYEPAQTSGKLKFYVKHTHEPDNCAETNLAHSLRDLRLAGEPAAAR
ncbi:metal ABC transporter ATP-binding protein [Paenibacillus flagellatus]|uniref:ABC transporter n=1 Tax=Paenibacillus flagellatus TaxID=2211139 RepID=A0A2V5K704_9BACL|nr:metal ABC transporter ATP-binding protein [Paenibacillus flagellatus]PYI55078.1 ABC transporter [Paenibacillus flagellatus]